MLCWNQSCLFLFCWVCSDLLVDRVWSHRGILVSIFSTEGSSKWKITHWLKVWADLIVHTSGSRLLPHEPPGMFCQPFSQKTPPTHTHAHTFFFFFTSNVPLPGSFLHMEHWPNSHCCLRVTHCRIPESWVLLTRRCGSVLRVYTGGKGVNATCFKELHHVLTSVLKGTLGKSWN